MTDTSKFRPEVMKLFEPGPPLRLVEQIDYEPSKRKTIHIDGIASFLTQLRKYKEEEANMPVVEPTEDELVQLNTLRKKKIKQLENKQKLDESYANWNPNEDPHIKGDPYKTLFIGRLDYEVTEIDLQQEFSKYGDIERVRVVRDKNTNKSKGYGFIVFEREISAREAYKLANGLKLKTCEILTDIERGRTNKMWLPRRLGGGIGGRGYTQRHKQKEQLQNHSFKSIERQDNNFGRNSRFSTRGKSGGFSNRGGRGGYDSYESRRSGYNGRSKRFGSDLRSRYDPTFRIERVDRSENKPLEYSSRLKREDTNFNDRQRDKDYESRIQYERNKEREHYKEKRIEQRERTRY